ncbi:MAG TPA: ABC transporter substrate-binding protein [Stellaceae bacterium]|nr:ABC transporter substrate-binding protein [Stellaceae bacterium]
MARFGWAFVAALICAAGGFGARAADKVSLGQVISIAQAPYYVALEKGYFAKAGIEIDSGNFRGGQDMVSSLATGQLDVGLGAFNAGFFNAASKGLDMRAVAALGAQPKAAIIATPPLVRTELWDNGTIRSGKDFKGRKIAVNTPGATPEYTLSLILEKYGMTLKDVDETMIGFPQMVIALANKSVDVAFVTSPFHAIALRDKTAVVLTPDANVTGGDITTVVFFSGKFMRERPQVGERFLRALVQGAKDTQGDYTKRPEMAQLLAKATGLKLQDIEESHVFAFTKDLDIDRYRDSIRRQEAQHMKDGRLDYTKPVPMDKMIDASLIKKALASAN